MSDFNALAMRCGLGRGGIIVPPAPAPVLSTILNEVDISFNGRTWGSQNAGLSDSFRASSDFSTMVFRTRYGENYAQAGDTSRRVRSEITSSRPGGLYVASGQTLHVTGTVRISGPTFSIVEWDSWVQLHSDDSLGVSPGFELCPLILGSGNLRLVTQVNYRRQTDGGSTQYLNYYDTINFTYDADHSFDVRYTDAYGGNNGRMIVILDGRTVCDYTGPTGYYGAAPNSSYLKLGIHAGVDTDGTFPPTWDQTTTLKNVVVTLT